MGKHYQTRKSASPRQTSPMVQPTATRQLQWSNTPPFKVNTTSADEVFNILNQAAQIEVVKPISTMEIESKPLPPSPESAVIPPPTVTDSAMTDVEHQTPPQPISPPSKAVVKSSSSTSPSTFVTSVKLFQAVAKPVSVAAVQVLHSWFGAVRGGVRRAWRLKNEWHEAQQARRQMLEMRARYQAEKVAAKEREKMAMQRLQQLEAQVTSMQQQLLYHQSHSPSIAAHLAHNHSSPPKQSSPVTSHTVPQAPPMTTSSVPMAPPLAMTSFVPVAPPLINFKPHTTNTLSTSALVTGANKLRTITSAIKPTSQSSSTGINMDMLKQVKLKQVTRPSIVHSTRPSVTPTAASAFNTTTFLFDALNARFHRGGMGVAAAVPRSNFSSRPSFGGVPIQTPLHPGGRIAGVTFMSSAFSPMTPHSEEQWTPAR